MEDSKKNFESKHRTSNASNQSSTGANTVEKMDDDLRSSSLLVDRNKSNAVEHHHHPHDSLDVERLERSFSACLLQFKELIRERDVELNELKQELLSKENRIKQLIVENEELKNECLLNAVQNDEDEIVVGRYQSRIDNSKLQLNDSNEDCLLKIFAYLSMNDMIQVKRVCKKWYKVSQQWFKQVQTLVFCSGFNGGIKSELYEKYYKRQIYKKIETFRCDDIFSILHSCGHHIKYIQLGRFEGMGYTPDEAHRQFIIQWVSILCKNIVEIRIDNWSIAPTSLMLMARHWKKLEKIYIEDLHSYESADEFCFELLRNNKQLKSLRFNYEIHNQFLMSGELFTYLPTTIKEISIGNILFDTKGMSHFISASKNFTSLQSFNLSRVYIFIDALAAAIADIKTLTHLTLNRIYSLESRKSIESFSNMEGLKSLYLINIRNLLEDDVIYIVENCIQLEVLFIYYCGEFTDRTMAAIAKSKKLRCLYIDMSKMTVELIINSCGNLEVLGCINSIMNNSDAITLLKKGTNLKLVDFIGCKNLSKNMSEEAYEFSYKKKNKILYVIGPFGWVDIDTPYFKYSSSRNEIPQELLPWDIKYYLE